MKLKLIKNWVYDIHKPKKKDDPGNFALALINRKQGTVTSRQSNDEELANKYKIWAYCREEFHNIWQKGAYSLLFAHNAGESNNISAFISEIESLLKLKTKSQVFETDQPHISAIKVSPWWVECPLKRQLFTIFLRTGVGYNRNLWETLKNAKYTSQCIPALKLFFSGYTEFSEECLQYLDDDFHEGFFEQFKNKNQTEIKVDGMLRKP